jgi:hypothetical protein
MGPASSRAPARRHLPSGRLSSACPFLLAAAYGSQTDATCPGSVVRLGRFRRLVLGGRLFPHPVAFLHVHVHAAR